MVGSGKRAQNARDETARVSGSVHGPSVRLARTTFPYRRSNWNSSDANPESFWRLASCLFVYLLVRFPCPPDIFLSLFLTYAQPLSEKKSLKRYAQRASLRCRDRSSPPDTSSSIHITSRPTLHDRFISIERHSD